MNVTDLANIPADQRDPLCKAFAEKGWSALDALAFRQLTGVKTHFLRVAVVGNEFHLEARQHDGSTGLVSPLVRMGRTRDPQKVGRLAGLLVGRDFGPIGTIEQLEKEPESVRVRCAAGSCWALSGSYTRAMSSPSPSSARCGRATRPKPGEKPAPDPCPSASASRGPNTRSCERRDRPKMVFASAAFSRRTMSRSACAGGVGFRCMKLATVEGPMQLKVADLNRRSNPPGNCCKCVPPIATLERRSDSRDAPRTA